MNCLIFHKDCGKDKEFEGIDVLSADQQCLHCHMFKQHTPNCSLLWHGCCYGIISTSQAVGQLSKE